MRPLPCFLLIYLPKHFLCSRLHDEIVAFAKWVRPTAEERSVRQLVTAAVERILLSCLPSDTRIVAFGSTVYDLCLPEGYA